MNKLRGLKNKIKSFNIYKNRTIFYIIPLAVILVAIICGVAYQLSASRQYFANIGIDFQGGTILQIEFEDGQANLGENYNKNLEIIKKTVKAHGPEVSVNQSSGESTIIVQYTNFSDGIGGTVNDADAMNVINNAIKSDLLDLSANGGIDKIKENGITFSNIGNDSSKNLLKTSAIAVGVALILMLVYIIIRFDFYSGLAAVIALLHDVIIMMSLTVIFYVEISDSIVAGLITIVAYSINNTIVVFDRIREVKKGFDKKSVDYNFVADEAVAKTLNRTLFTTITTMIMVIMLTALGVVTMRYFTLPILFGLVAGFYSSTFLVAPIWASMQNGLIRTRAKKYAKYKQQAKIQK